MTRGDQRDRDRAAALKKAGASGKKQSGDPQKRKEADAKALADKMAVKAAAKAELEANGGVVPKKRDDNKPKV